MPASLRDLRRKIKSIKSTQKITSAMQLVAASKMQRATRKATQSRPFTESVAEIVSSLVTSVDPSTQPLFAHRPVKSVLLALVTTNRGLAGALNTQLLRMVSLWIREHESKGQQVKIVAVGGKGRAYLTRYFPGRLIADFPSVERVPDYKDSSPVAQLLLEEFTTKRSDRVYLAFNAFQSTLRQEPTILPYLPFKKSDLSEGNSEQSESQPDGEVLFEPSQEEILSRLLPRYLSARLYQVFLEAHASEQSARMLAMKNATDNAGDLVNDLNLTYNSSRQSAITGELLDIAGGAAALEN